MKRTKWAIMLMALVLAVALVAAVAGCGDEETVTTAAPATETTAPATESTEAPTTTEAETTTTEEAFEPVDLKFSYHTPVKASMVGAYFEPWSAAVEAATEGLVTITHYPEGSLVKEEQQLDGLLSNASDIALIEPEFNANVFPRTEFATLPGLFPNTEVASNVFWDMLQEYGQEEWSDLQILGVVVLSGGPYVGNEEVKLPEDLQGLRMRSGGKIETWLIEELGGTPVEIGLGDLPTQFERNAVDGAFLSWSLILSLGIKDVTTYRTDGDLIFRCWVLAMNKDVWESLPGTVQEQIMSASGKENSTMYNLANEEATQGAKGAVAGSDKGQGKPGTYTLSAEEKAQWSAACDPVWDKWVENVASDVPAQEMIDKATSLVQQYSGQ